MQGVKNNRNGGGYQKGGQNPNKQFGGSNNWGQQMQHWPAVDEDSMQSFGARGGKPMMPPPQGNGEFEGRGSYQKHSQQHYY